MAGSTSKGGCAGCASAISTVGPLGKRVTMDKRCWLGVQGRRISVMKELLDGKAEDNEARSLRHALARPIRLTHGPGM